MTLKSKKILYIITKSVWAGASKYVYDLAVSLPPSDFKVMVAGGTKRKMAEKITSANIPYFEIKNFQRNVNIFKDAFAFFEVLSLLFRTKPDIVHVSSAKAGGVSGTAFLIYKSWKNLKMLFRKNFPHVSSGETIFSNFSYPLSIFTAHGWTFNESRPKWQTSLIKFFSKLTCLFYNKIICVSKYDYNSAIENKITPTQKLVMIHNGIKPEDYKFLPKEEARKKLGLLDTEYLTIGTIGEFTKNKGHKYLIEAVKQVPNLKLVIIGFGKEKEIDNTVSFIENLPDAGKFLKAFDIFVLSSLKEGLPYVLLEAGLAELPVIATDVGGVPEIIGRIKNNKETTGLLIPPADSEAITQAIERLINNPLLRQGYGGRLRGKILQEFSFSKMLEETKKLYK